MTDLPAFGVAWAPDGDTRPGRFCTPLAWVDGHDGGLLYVQNGPSERNDREWLMVAEWHQWVAQTRAAPVLPEADPPGSFEDPEQGGGA